MRGIGVTPELLAQAAQGVDQAAQDMADQVNQLQSTVTTDNPWGSDQPGTAFGMLYTAVLGHALQSMGSHVDKLTEGAEGLAAWAQVMAATEQANVKTVST